MADFDKTMSKVKTTAATTGATAGGAFKDEFVKQQDGLATNFAKSVQNSIRGAFAAAAVAAALRTTLESAAEGANIGDSLAAGIKSIPVIGAVASAFETGLGLALGVFDEERKTEQMRKSAQELEARAERVAQEAAKREEQILERKDQVADLVAQKEVRAAMEAGDERLAATLEAERQIAALRKRIDEELGNAKWEDEKQGIRDLYAAEKALIDQQRDEKYEEIARKEAEVQKKAAEAEQKRREETLAALKTDLESIQSQRDAIRGATASASTAIGEFKFAAYTDSEKKQLDQDLLSQVRQINSKAASLGGFL